MFYNKDSFAENLCAWDFSDVTSIGKSDFCIGGNCGDYI